jgi:hypothetical protein
MRKNNHNNLKAELCFLQYKIFFYNLIVGVDFQIKKRKDRKEKREKRKEKRERKR